MSNSELSCAFTGYRPEKFSFKLYADNPEYIKLKNNLNNTVTELVNNGCRCFYCGMAAGFDILAGEIAVELKKALPHLNIRVIAVVPFKGQENGWNCDWKMRYNRLLSCADTVVYISESYSKAAYHMRNRYLINNSDIVVTYFNGKQGGTAYTLNYAAKNGKKILNVANI